MRRNRIRVHLYEKEYQRLKDQAKYMNMPMAEFIRHTLENNLILKIDMEGYKDIWRISNNIKQIVGKGEYSSSEVEDNLLELDVNFQYLLGVLLKAYRA